MAPPASTRRKALETLGRDRLVALADALDVDIPSRRSKDAAIDALAGSRKLDFGSMLGELSRDELKGICRALGLDDWGKEKAPIIKRILGGYQSAAIP